MVEQRGLEEEEGEGRGGALMGKYCRRKGELEKEVLEERK